MSRYNGSLTREQFMFREMRMVAQLYKKGQNTSQIIESVMRENLFQYPTEREVKGKCRVALRRLEMISSSETLLGLLAEGTLREAKQAALVAMMCDSQLLADFMVEVVGEKYRRLEMTITRKDVNLFFEQLRERDQAVGEWSDSTVRRIRSVLMNVLRENGYLEGIGSEELVPVLISEEFETALRAAGLRRFLPAFNILE